MEQVKSNPLVSIIIGTKNRCKILPRAVRSALEQTYKNIEVVIVNCASVDDTELVVKSFADSRIKYLKLSTDPGRVESLNQGIYLSRGEYLTFLDDDDEFADDKVEIQLHELQNSSSKLQMVSCWSEIYDDVNQTVIKNLNRDYGGSAFKIALEEMPISGFPSLMVSRTALQSIGYFVDKASYPSDWLFVCRLTKQFEIRLIQKTLVRIHVNHIYERMSAPKIKDEGYYKRVMNFHIEFLNEFEEDFMIFPKSSLGHIDTVISCAGLLKDFAIVLKYYWKGLKVDVFRFKIHKRFAMAILRITFRLK